MKALYDSLEQYLLGMGDDVAKKVNKNYFAFRRLRNFGCVEVHPQAGKLLVYVKVDLDEDQLEPGFTRDVSTIGPVGTGNLEITIATAEDLDRAMPVIASSYEAN